MRSRLVAGVDSSTQSCKVVIRDADTGALHRSGRAPHPKGTEVDPESWWTALQQAITDAGGLDDVSAIAIAGQQHGLVALDSSGEVIRPAILWNDTRSAQAAIDLKDEWGERKLGSASMGPQAWVTSTGSVPVPSLTVTKLRWLAEHEPDNAERIAAIALPHDWLTWRLRGAGSLETLITDRSEASGTGYFDPVSNTYCRDLLTLALGRRSDEIILPDVANPCEVVGYGDQSAGLGHVVLGPGAGDNAAAALGLELAPGDVAVSIGTSAVASAVSSQHTRDASGTVASFADAAGNFLPLTVSLNGAQVLDTIADLLQVDHEALGELALRAHPAAQGLTFIPYLSGERTPNLPLATGSLLGLTLESATRENLARATMEGVACGLVEGVETLRREGIDVSTVSLIGGAARSSAFQQIISALLAMPVQIPKPSEYVADGAARQAAWVLNQEEAPIWRTNKPTVVEATPAPQVRQTYNTRRHLFTERRA